MKQEATTNGCLNKRNCTTFDFVRSTPFIIDPNWLATREDIIRHLAL